MADERLRIKIEADAKRAEKDLKTLGKLADELTEDELTILVNAKTDAAEADIKRMTKLLDQAEDPADIKVILSGIAAATDKVEQLHRQVEKVDAETIDIKTDTTVRNFDNLEQSAGSSKSVLANMVGNTAQDLGALGGVAGSAGVAIGQMAEYMADASASGEGMGSIVRNFSKIIGPMLALSAATLAGTKAWEAYTTRTKETAKLTKEASDALAEQSGVMDAIKADVEGGTDAWSQLNRALAESEDEFPKIAKAMGALGIPVEDMSRTLAALEGDSRSAMRQMYEDAGIPLDMADAFAKATDKGESFKEIFNLLPDNRLKDAAKAYRPVIDAVEELNDAQQKFDVEEMAKNQLEAAAASEEWGEAVKQARFELRDGATQLQIFERFSRIQADTLAEQAGETAKATAKQELWRAEMDRSNEAFAEAQAAAKAYADTVAGADFGETALEGATTAMSAFTEAQFAAGNNIQEQSTAWDAYVETVKKVGVNMDTTTEKGAKQQDALEDLAATLDDDLATAYTDAAGDGEKFRTSASKIADTLRDRLRKELGLSDTEINEVLTSLGLMPDQIETRYTLSGTEEAKLKLDLLSGSIDSLPKDVKAKVTQQIITGDYVGALNTVQSYYNRNPATLPVNVRLTQSSINAMNRGLATGVTPSMAPVPPDEAGVATLGATSYGTTPAPYAAAMPTFTAPTVKVKFSGDYSDLTRAVRAFASATHTGRNIQSTTQRYVWRNGRSVSVP